MLTSPNRILVTGSTGRLGIRTLGHLGGNALDNVAFARPSSLSKLPFGAAYRIGDYEDVSSLMAAFDNIDTLIFISSDGDFDTMLRHHRNVVTAFWQPRPVA